VGLLTADITPIGVVLTGDSQAVELGESSVTVQRTQGAPQSRPCLVAHGGTDFAAALGFVGTETIGNSPTNQWLQRFCASRIHLNMDEFCRALTDELTSLWHEHSYETCLWIFICGASAGEPIFRAVRNCGPDMDGNLLYTRIKPDFVWHNDLANHVSTYGRPGETLPHVLAHTMALYRNGVLLPAVGLLDGFRQLTEALLNGGFRGFAPVGSLDAYADIVRMRSEFVKRMFDPAKGIYQEAKPIGGTIYVYRVELDGAIYEHKPKAKPVRLLPAR
jgi:hypothetical protein